MRAALTAPGALTSPAAGRVLAKLLVVVAIEGGNDLIMPYLVPAPGSEAGFEVRAYRAGVLVPTDVRPVADAVAALRIAIRLAREGDVGVEVLSRTEGGLERCVFVRDSTGEFEFRYATNENLNGDPDACRAAQQQWEATMAAWRSWLAKEHPTPISRESVSGGPLEAIGDRPPPVPAALTEDAIDWGAGQPVTPFDQPTASFDVLLTDESDEQAESDQSDEDEQMAGSQDGAGALPKSEPADAASGPARPDADAEADSEARETETATETETETPTAFPTDRAATATTTAPGSPPPTTPAIEVGPSSPTPSTPLFESLAIRRPLDTEVLIDAIRQGFATLDFAQVDQLIHAALDSHRRDLTEPLARRLSALLADALALPDAHELAASVAPLVPRPGDVAELVTARIGALLSETVLRRPADTTAQAGALPEMAAAVERVELQLADLRDQVRRSADLVEVFSDQLTATERRALLIQSSTGSLEREMQRLARSVDDQVARLAANAGGGSELSDGVARLTRKLRQSVAQLDRALLRLDDVLDQTETAEATEATEATEVG